MRDAVVLEKADVFIKDGTVNETYLRTSLLLLMTAIET